MLPQSGGANTIIEQWRSVTASNGTAMHQTDSGTLTISAPGTCIACGVGAGGNNAVIQIYHNGTLLADTGWLQTATATRMFKVKAGDTVRVYVRSYKGSWNTTQSAYFVINVK